jgi:2-polyprenyl-6-methoxyphenol hydroxylase-like FAD-dependent oxidoreductase
MTNSLIGKQAVVLGGSMAGLAAARALSNHYEKVIVIERDTPAAEAAPRKGTPQSHHAHALLKSGENALNKLFPKFTDNVIANGAHQIDFSADVKWFHAGNWKMRYQSDFKVLVQSRPLLEHELRKQFAQVGNVQFYYGYEVCEMVASMDASTIVGVNIQHIDKRGDIEFLASDLVVDASGRGSRTPQCLEKLGYARPEETQVKIDLTYSSRIYEMSEGANYDWRILLLNPEPPKTVRAGYVFPVEDNRWLVTLAGYSGDRTPQDNDSFLEYAKGLANLELYNVLRTMKPVTDVKVFSVPATVNRHYEKLSQFPTGLVVMGDAKCAFDPVFGQGMSVATLEAVALDDMLAQESAQSMATFPQRFHKKAAEIVFTPLLMGTSEDFRYPGTVGKKAFFIPFMQWYSMQVFELSAFDKVVYEAFRDAMGLLAGPEVLFKPAVALKVFKHAFSKRKQQHQPAPEFKRQTNTIPSV